MKQNELIGKWPLIWNGLGCFPRTLLTWCSDPFLSCHIQTVWGGIWGGHWGPSSDCLSRVWGGTWLCLWVCWEGTHLPLSYFLPPCGQSCFSQQLFAKCKGALVWGRNVVKAGHCSVRQLPLKTRFFPFLWSRQIWTTIISPKCVPFRHCVPVHPRGGQGLEASHHD